MSFRRPRELTPLLTESQNDRQEGHQEANLILWRLWCSPNEEGKDH